MAEKFGQQVTSVLSDDAQRLSGEEAVSMNIEAGSAVAEAVRTTLGPRGMDKMLVSSSGDVVVTNDGVTVLEEMDVDHPVADMVVDVAETQESEVGDGTTTAVVVAGELLGEAEELLDRGIHASTIVGGYQQAADEVDAALDEIAVEVSADDTETLERVAKTAMTGKGAEAAVETLAPMVVEAVTRSMVDGVPNIDTIKVSTFDGRTIHDSRLIDGLMVDKNVPHPSMPTSADDADILVYEGELELQETAPGANIEVSTSDEYEAFIDREREELDEIAAGIIDAGVDAVFTTGAIDETVQGALAEAGVVAIRHLRDEDLEKIVRTTNANAVSDLDDLSEADLGHAGAIRQETVAQVYGPKSAEPEKTLVLRDIEDANAVSLILRGGTQHVVDELERAVEDALRAVDVTLREGVVVPGGGAPEIALARHLREHAESVSGREQLAVEAVADSLEIVPRTLARNAGKNMVDAIVGLRSEHDSGATNAGIDGYSGEITDTLEAGVVEPKSVKRQAITSGIEAVNSILRIDDVVSVGELAVEDEDEDEAGGPGGGMGGGMGGMGGGMGGMGGM